MLFTITCIILVMAENTKPFPVDLGEVKNFVTNFNSQTTLCKPVTPPCFVCTSPTTKAQRNHCSDPPVTFKYTTMNDPCVTDNPCTCPAQNKVTRTPPCRTTCKCCCWCTTPKTCCPQECRCQTRQPACKCLADRLNFPTSLTRLRKFIGTTVTTQQRRSVYDDERAVRHGQPVHVHHA